MAKKRGKAKHKSRTKSVKIAPSKFKKSKISKKKKTSTHKSKTKVTSKARAKPRKKRTLHIIPRPKLIEEKIMKAPHELEEEFFMPSPIHRGKYLIPLGIRFLIGYLLFLSVFYIISFIYGITFPTTILFGQMISGSRALIINSVLLALILFMVYGFWKRKAYTFDLSIGFFSFTALNAVISVMLFESAEHPIFKKLLLLSFISLVLMNIIIVWYILHERKYFYAQKFKDRPFHHRDKVFLYIMITFWTVALLLGGTLGYQFYKDTTRLVDKNLQEMHGDYYRGQLLCEQKEGPDRDICTLVVATALSAKMDPSQGVTSQQFIPKEYLVNMCDTIKSDFYHFTCMRSIEG